MKYSSENRGAGLLLARGHQLFRAGNTLRACLAEASDAFLRHSAPSFVPVLILDGK